MKTPFCHHPPRWWARGNGKVGPAMLDASRLVSKGDGAAGKSFPSQGRILSSCLNQASLFARAGPPYALLFLVPGALPAKGAKRSWVSREVAAAFGEICSRPIGKRGGKSQPFAFGVGMGELSYCGG